MVGFERLSGDYNRGYTKAICDIKDVFDYIDNDLKWHNKRLTPKLTKELLNCVLENREKLRDNWNGSIRWNTQKNGFEFFSKE